MDRVSQSLPSTKRKRGRGRNGVAERPASTELYLATVGTHVAPAHYRDRPLFAQLVTEDTCWQFAVAEWQSRKPPLFRLSARRAWREEGSLLDDKRERTRTQAAELGLRLSDAEPPRLGRRRAN